MKINWNTVYFAALLIGALAMFGIGAWGMWQSNKRSKTSDKKWDQERADMAKRTKELHDLAVEYSQLQLKQSKEQHAAIMKHIESHGPRKQPWEEN